jgi:hypothetical protein
MSRAVGALLSFKHDGNGVPGEQKRGAHVGVHHVVVLLSACVHEVLIIAHARVVNQDVDLPEGLHCGFDRLFSRAFLSGIAEDADALRAQLFCLLLELVEPLLAPRREHQSHALFGQGTGAAMTVPGTRLAASSATDPPIEWPTRITCFRPSLQQVSAYRVMTRGTPCCAWSPVPCQNGKEFETLGLGW